jgi:hypothetical protein
MDDLKVIFEAAEGALLEPSLTLTVDPNGDAGFAVGADGKATVSESFLLEEKLTDIFADFQLMLGTWIAMAKSNVYLAWLDNSKEIVRMAFVAI